MAKKKEFIYRVDEAKKKVYIDETVAPTKVDEMRYSSYISAGFKTHVKSQKKVEIGKEIAKKNKLGKKNAKAENK